MISRQRFLKTMRYRNPDRVPYFEEGLREDVLERWYDQGLSRELDLAEMFHMDHRERVPVNIEPHPPLKKWPTSRRGLQTLRGRLIPDDPARFPSDWHQKVRSWRTREHVLELNIHRGFFLSMGVGDWTRFEQVIELLHDDPRFVCEVMRLHSEFAARLAERILSEVEVDCVAFSEPIGGNDRPLLSPAMYRKFVLDSYRPVLEVVREHGVETIIFLTYANARVLLRDVVDTGFNCLWACEVETEAMDYRAIRREFGRNLRLIGGIDLDVLTLDKEAIRREMEAKVPPLLAAGGYIPLADGRVRSNVPFENYAFYRLLLEDMTRQAG